MKPVQLDMALAALKWGVRDLATAANISMDTIARFKRGETLKSSTVCSMKEILENSGIVFIEENENEIGVKIKKKF